MHFVAGICPRHVSREPNVDQPHQVRGDGGKEIAGVRGHFEGERLWGRGAG